MGKTKKIIAGVIATTLVVLSSFSLDLARANPEDDSGLNSTEQIVKQYTEGVKMLPEQIEARKSKAEELGLLDFVDENYFLVDSFYQGKSHQQLEDMGVNILINTMTGAEIDAWISNLKAGVNPLTVTDYAMISYGGSTVGRFAVDGKLAFCAQHSATTPAAGAPTGNPVLVTNDNMRRALYYGYGGPQQLASLTDSNFGIVVTSLALSRYNGDGHGNIANSFCSQIESMPAPPAEFKVYKVSTNGGSTQDLAYYNLERPAPAPKGSLNIIKSSATPEFTNGNNCYSLAGGVYGLFTDAGATNKIGDLTLDATGQSNTIGDLNPGTYYVKEITAPKGYALDPTVHTVAVAANATAVGRVSDKPQNDPVGILVRKVDANTGNANSSIGKSLADAQFTVKYFAGEYADNVNPETGGVTPTRTWVLKTDNDGFCNLDDAYKVSGDAFYTNTQGRPTLPLGTITIQETKAPVGYEINPEIFVRRITSQGSAESVNTYNEPTIEEIPVRKNLRLVKIDAVTGVRLANAVFKITKEDGTEVMSVTTNNQGIANITGLEFGKYFAQETQAPNGYVINSAKIPFTIDENTTDIIEITAPNNKIKGKIKVIKTDGKTIRPLRGAKFGVFKKDNTKVGEITTGTDGTAITGDLEFGEYYIQELEAPTGYLVNSTKYPVNITENARVYEVGVTNNLLKGKIKVIKVDGENNRPLAGAKFGVFKADNTKVGEITTGADGTAVTADLEFGEYYIQELEAPTGYLVNRNKFPISIEENNRIYEVRVTNQIIKGKIKVIKIDGLNSQPVKDAEFGVFKKDNTRVGTIKTGNDGTAITGDLPYGEYYIQETKAPTGYLLNTTKFPINITENARVYEVRVRNEVVMGKVKVIKQDKEIPSYKIKGVQFTIYDKAGTAVDTITTNDNGIAISKDLRYGEYTMRETKPANGYLANNTVYNITIDTHEQVVEFTVNNQIKKGRIQIVKVDQNNEERPVEGAEFDIIAENVQGVAKGTVVEHVITDKDGFAFSGDLRFGTYKIKETKAPDGYWLSTKEYFVDVRNHNAVHVRYISNKPIEAKLHVIKTDGDTVVPLEGVTFEIWNVKENKVVEFFEMKGLSKVTVTQFKTDEDGSFLTPQPIAYGKYELREVEAPDCYIKVEPIPFEINDKTSMEDIEGIGTVTTMEVENHKIKGGMRLEKWFNPTAIDRDDRDFTLPANYAKADSEEQVDEVPSEEPEVETTDEVPSEGQVEETTDEEPVVDVTPEDNGEPYMLKGVGFELFKLPNNQLLGDTPAEEADWQSVGVICTGDFGYIELENMEYGTYKLVELNLPDNFIEVDDIIFDITESEVVIELKAENEVKTGITEITKFDIHDGTLLPGAEFEILDEDKNVILDGVTDENGLFSFTLETGKYYYKETLAPTLNGTEYVLDEEAYPFEIKENGEIVKCKAPNKKKIVPKTSASVGGYGIALALTTLGGTTFYFRKRKINKQ
ncbi:collagen binding domain-containing protein [uncultured Clostridium sp.]|uniref:MSCRAMM family protein n=1 Tax=uncultured Clostridium sp. TaxID=59620 RepID=UPI0026F38C54|nr:SpaA isopeptide-forming pilin-related protein [uncultured Clostridium sp.]